MSAPHLELGRQGEELAAAYLTGLGFEIIERNARGRTGELDLVCRQGDTLVFVEVKTRGPGSRARPDQAVNPRKRGRLARAAAAWLGRRNMWDRPCRFDVVAVTLDGERTTVRHYENAFSLQDAPGRGGLYQPF